MGLLLVLPSLFVSWTHHCSTAPGAKRQTAAADDGTQSDPGPVDEGVDVEEELWM